MTNPARSRKTVLFALTTVLLLAFASTAWAAAGADHQVDSGVLLKDFLYRCLNFAVVVGILVYFVRKPMLKGLAGRREDLAAALRDAQQAREEAEAKYAEYEKKLADATAEIDEIQKSIRAEGELERDRILAQAREMADKIGRDSEKAADQEVEKAIRSLRMEAASLSIEIARELLRKNFSGDDQKRLVEEYVQKMQKVGELQ